jgi:hypothetical protein
MPIDVEEWYSPFVQQHFFSKNKFGQYSRSAPKILVPTVRTVFKKGMSFVSQKGVIKNGVVHG